MRILLLLLSIVLDSSYSNETRSGNPVEVRAVFINCEPEEKDDISPGNKEMRFEREELFKHSVLQKCNKKVALTVKITDDPEQVPGDEYIPIEHVFQGQNKRVRLLNPYVLRLQRGTLLQAYRLHKLESVIGVVDNMNMNEPKNADLEERLKRAVIQILPENNQDCELSDNSTLHVNTCLHKRIKRHEHNVIVESDLSMNHKTQQWPAEPDYEEYKNRRSSNLYASSPSIINLPFIKSERTYNAMDKENIGENGKYWDSNKDEEYKRKSLDIEDSTLESEWDSEENSGKLKQNIKSYSKNQFEKEFDVFEIATPELLFNVKVQLFEKLTNSEGKTLWNDITKGESAGVSSTAPEWSAQDINIRYNPMQRLPKDLFALPPLANLCLLTPASNHKQSETDSSTALEEKYIVVPKEDILNLENDNVIVKKRDDNLTDDDYSPEQILRQKRRVLIRTTRAIYGDQDNYTVRLDGEDPMLTVPHHRTHQAQIDLEARADENQLVPIGASGRIMTVVSDSSRRTKSTLTVQVTNTGLAAAKFRTVARECGPDFDAQLNGAETHSNNHVLIPPRHTKSVRIDIPTVPADVFHCLVSLVNDDDESVAVRDVTIKRGDRCFCVWHCECTCLSEDPKLLCREMSEAGQIAAGLSLRERARRVRSVCYHDDVSVDMLVTGIGIIFMLLFMGKNMVWE